MSKQNSVTVTQGQILVNDCYLTHRTRNFMAWTLDCHSKYAEVGAYSGRDVMLMAGEYTLKADKGEDVLPTVVTLPKRVLGKRDDWETTWHVMATAARYTVTIVAWKPRKSRWWRKVWESEVEHHARMEAD